MATSAFELDLPALPGYDAFVNGEKVVAATSALNNADAYATFWFSRRLYLPPGKYVMTLMGNDAAGVMIGTDLRSSRLIGSSKDSIGVAATFEFFVLPGETRLDVRAHNLTNAPGSCCFALNIARDGKLVYASSAEDWLVDGEAVADSDLLGDVDPLAVLPVFTVLPNWRDGITERLEYLTDIMTSNTGVEQRRSVRIYPRRSFEAGFSRHDEMRARLDNFIAGIGRRPFLVPLWHEQYRVPAAFGLSDEGVSLPAGTVADREFRVGDAVLVTGGDAARFEIATIAALDGTSGAIVWGEPLAQAWPAGTRIIPLRKARLLDDPELTAMTGSVGETRMRFSLADPDDLFPDAAWDGDPLWTFSPNFATALSFNYNRDDYSLDNQSGPVDLTDASNQARIGQKIAVLLRGRSQVFAFRRFLAAARGRAMRFYMPNHVSDLVPSGDIGGAYLECKAAGFADIVQTDQAARHKIAIVRYSGSPIYRNVTSVLRVNDGDAVVTERFYLDTPLPVVAPSNVRRIEWLVTSRFDQDAFELLHHVDDSRAVAVSIATRSVDADGMDDISSEA